MKLKHFLLLLLFIPLHSHAQDFRKPGFFVIKGQVKNFKDPLFDFGMTTYFSNITNSVVVKPDGNFEQQFPIQNQQKIYFNLNDNAFTFTVAEKDTLFMEWDKSDFKKTFSIKGKNTVKTMELQNQINFYNSFRKPLVELNNHLYEPGKDLTPEKKYNLINDFYCKNIKAVFDSSGYLSQNTNHLITSLYFECSSLLWTQQLIPQYKLKLELDTTRTNTYFDIANSLDYTFLNEEWFWNVPEYRSFIYDYIRFLKPFKSGMSNNDNDEIKSNPTLDEYYLAQSNIFFTNIKDWFITSSIMQGFGSYSFADVENVYTQFMNTCKTPFLKDTLQKYYTAIKRLKPGNPAPGFSLKNEKSQVVSLSDFKGKVVYIDFWGVGCGPCIYDIKNYVPKLHELYKNKDVVFINICVDSKDKEWKEALEKYKLDGVNLIAEGWTINQVCKMYNISGIPHYILVDKNGKIANNNAPRASELNDKSGNNPIDQLLK